MPNLEETQRAFWRLITAPEAADGGAGEWIRGDERLGAVDRVQIYAGMYFHRLLECLAEDFAAVHAVVGHERFHRLAADYLAVHPSRHPSLRMLGRELAGFLETHPFGAEWPYLADLARFEWALLEAFDAADASPIAPERLKSLPMEEWPRVKLSLTPSLRVIELSSPVQTVWSAVVNHEEPPPIAPAPTVIRVWREELRVFHRAIDAVELVTIRAVERHDDFAAVCEAAAGIVGAERAGQTMLELLERWLGDRLVVGFEPV